LDEIKVDMTMPFNRTSSRVAIGLLAFFLATPSFAQGPEGMQLFEHADCSTMGGDIQPNDGFFFQFDGLYWAVLPPRVTPVGFPDLVKEVFVGPGPNDSKPQTNSVDTSDIRTQWSQGYRFEFGRVEDRNGWMCTVFQIRDQEQDFLIPSMDMAIQDSSVGPSSIPWLAGPTTPGGPPRELPITFLNVEMNHSISNWGVELNYLHRFLTCHDGGTFEMFLGARYFYFEDDFSIATGAATAGLGDSNWQNYAENNLIGPQLGVRWFKKQGRWMLSTEGRFMAGLNCQNIHQNVDFGPHLTPSVANVNQPLLLGPTNATYDGFAREWSPLIELRLEARYQITRYLSFHAGWTGLWADGIARGDATINYSIDQFGHAFGIDLTRNREQILENGLTMGFDFNR
jgi:hypothetical protein